MPVSTNESFKISRTVPTIAWRLVEGQYPGVLTNLAFINVPFNDSMYLTIISMF